MGRREISVASLKRIYLCWACPAGVKVHSAVFAIDQKGAARLLTSFVQTGLPLTKAEVMDIDEEAFRVGKISARLFGHMLVPFEVDLIQPTKLSSPTTSEEKEQQLGIAKYIVENMEPDTIYMGPYGAWYNC